MRLVTHNMLKCNVKGVENGYPLLIEAEKVEVIESEFNPDLVKNLLTRLNWEALKSAARNLSMTELDGIAEATEEVLQDESILRRIHRLLFDVHVIEGFLVCPESGRKFPVKEGIPNMLLHEDEV